MRFRAKFGLLNWLWVSLGTFCLVLRCLHPSKTTGVGFYFVIMVAASMVNSHFFTYWEPQTEGLFVRQHGYKWLVPWQEVTRVANCPGDAGQSLQIDYSRAAPFSHRGSVRASPADRDSFLAEVRRLAPHAEFGLKDSASILG